MSGITPMMRQYLRIKQDHQDAILFYHMGDFYEMFYQDAEDASRLLNIALTTRDRQKGGGVPLCGIPCHAAESYINRLLDAGRKVAICDQVEESSASRGLVRREVTRIITPGTVLDDKLLEGKSNNFILSIAAEGGPVGLSAADISTGEFTVLELPAADSQAFEDRLAFFAPAEILLAAGTGEDFEKRVSLAAPQAMITPVPPETFDYRLARESLCRHFKVQTLETFGCDHFTAGAGAAGALLAYIKDTQRRPLHNLTRLAPFDTGDTMVLDASSQKNLELVSNLEDGRRQRSLLSVLDRTATSMGGRKLRSWILSPLMDTEAIELRLDAVQELMGDVSKRKMLRKTLAAIHDLERLGSRIALNTGTPRDLSSLRSSLRALPSLMEELLPCSSSMLSSLASLDLLGDVLDRLESRLVEEPPLKAKDGGLIRKGVSSELDELREVSRDARAWLTRFEAGQRRRTGIQTLKVGFNKIYGYYMEVTKLNVGRVPEDYTRKQTLVNAERFHCPELREFEERILGAEEKIAALELSLFEELRAATAAEAERLQKTASGIAVIDVLLSLADCASELNFCRPQVSEGRRLEIVDGRHPVIERSGEERFVPNNCSLDSSGCQIMIITGPNMAGKSTYLRQVALIALMAQIGSFVPAAEAHIGLVDRIFTRIGAADKLSRGQSTFMVEMVETASILRNATDRSLIILDEVGRGTSTFDGLSIAWAIADELHGTGPRGPKTLFATHYHQLTELPLTLERARNFNIAVKEWEGKILFLRKIVEGGTDKSYGIQVAQLAGLPDSTIRRAREILANLEESELNLDGYPQLAEKSSPPPRPPRQMDIFTSAEGEVLRRLRTLDMDNTTPIEALRVLSRLIEDIEKSTF
jgi:DNA mismatch repair protein MutS